MQRRIQRAFAQLQRAGGHALDVERDRIAVHGAVRVQRLQDEQVDRALQSIVGVLRHPAPVAGFYSWLYEA